MTHVEATEGIQIESFIDSVMKISEIAKGLRMKHIQWSLVSTT